jgi:hypothetical protein
MRTRNATLVILFALLPIAASGWSQESATNAPAATNVPLPAAETTREDTWSFATAVAGYLVPDSRDYVQPTFTADRGWLHLEARYNYESLDTGSAWLGYNLGGGGKVTWELTPMLGGVFGEFTGIAPGYKGSVSWWKLELYSEGEYVFDLGDSSGSFFYNWSEFSVWPVDWFRVGMATQRTRLYQTDREMQRGLLVGISYQRLDFTTYVFNPGASQPTIVLTAGFSF